MGTYRIYMFRSKPHISFSLTDWISGKEPVLFVTGLSGAGKTSLLSSLKREYNCTAVSLDALRFYEKAPTDSQRAVDDFLVLYPNIRQYVQNHWDSKEPGIHGEREYTKYTILFVDFLVRQAQRQQRRCIIEGIQLFVRLPKEALSGWPKLILGTGGIQCFQQALLRDFRQPSLLDLPSLLKRFFRYSVAQKVCLNRSVLYWQKTEEPAVYQKRQSTKKISDSMCD